MAAGTAVETLMAALQPQVPRRTTQQPPETIRRSIGSACEKASQAVEELRDAVEGLAEVGLMAGTGAPPPAASSRPSPSGPWLPGSRPTPGSSRSPCSPAGSSASPPPSGARRLKHGADEITDIELGADLGRLLPSELVKLTHRTRRLLLLKNLLERQAMQYQLSGNEPLGKGPLVVLLDKIRLHGRARDIWATALSLALLDQAQRERRTFALLAFDYRVKFEAVVKPGEPLPEEALFTACAGGTEIADAVARGLELIATNQGHSRRPTWCSSPTAAATRRWRPSSGSRPSSWASPSWGWASAWSASGSRPGATRSRSSRTSPASTTPAPSGSSRT